MQLGVARRGAVATRPGPEDEGPVPGYRLIKRIGIGGSGEVWAAEGPGGFAAALKIVKVSGEPRDVDLRAIEVLREVRHPNLLAGFGSWLVDGVLIVATERADGSLWDRAVAAVGAGRTGIPRDELVALMGDAAKGVDFLNEHRHAVGDRKGLGIQHCDLKPQNILLVGGGVKVGDFGSARWMGEAITGISSKGWTPAYAPPEFFVGVVTRHSDQYSLAVTYCQLRGGRLPFVGDASALMTGHVMHPPDLSMLDEAERPAVARALAKLPEDRWPDCRTFLESLRADLAASEARPAPPPAPGPITDPQASPSVADDEGEAEPEPTVTRMTGVGRTGGRRVVAAASLLIMGGVAVWAGGLVRERPRPSSRRPSGGGPGPLAGAEARVLLSPIAPAPDDPEAETRDVPPHASDASEVVETPAPAVAGTEGTSHLGDAPGPDPDRAPIEPPATPEVGATREAAPPPIVAKAEVVAPAAARPGPSPTPVPQHDAMMPSGRPASDREARCRGDAHMIRGERDRAILVYTEAIRLAPDDSEAHYGRSRAHAALGDHDRAIADLDAVLRLKHDDARALADRGLARFEQGRLHHAIADFDAVIRLLPRSAVAHYNRGRLYAALGDTDEALAEFAAALRLDPASSLARAALDETRSRRVSLARARSMRVRASWLKSPSQPPPPPAPKRPAG